MLEIRDHRGNTVHIRSIDQSHRNVGVGDRKYQLSYQEWISLQVVQKTFNDFIFRFNNEYMIQN